MKKFLVEYIPKDPVNSLPIKDFFMQVWVLVTSKDEAIKLVEKQHNNVYKIEHVCGGA